MRPRLNQLLFAIQVLASWTVWPVNECGESSCDSHRIFNATSFKNYADDSELPCVLAAAGTFPPVLSTTLYEAPSSSTGAKFSCTAPFVVVLSGRDSTATMRPRLNQLLFAIQVGKTPSFTSVKSNYVCLVVLPRPGALLECVAACFDSLCFLVLLLSGDVELNPGPLTEVQLAAILDGQRTLNNSISEIKSKLDEHIRQTESRLSSIETKVECLSKLEPDLKRCENYVQHLGRNVTAMAARVDALENRSRHNNLIIYGVAEDSTESPVSLNQKVVTEIFDKKLGVKVSTIEKIHRLGRHLDNKTRPILIRFSSLDEKAALLKNAFKLKGTTVSLSNDYSIEVREKRRHLWTYAKARREEGISKVNLTNDKLVINGKMFTWNSEREEVVPVQRN
ncbi:uncharacterized protein LOC120842405 [Ixodes scapularis]|uniref:uncharacterized protein LOC120842405 n=1 Tax=Ixodes scapularis TaxID=6945 RepID=UPI001A9FFAF3|nr:uncharacterized protein LOC120842405 [Ixodes scapularis]